MKVIVFLLLLVVHLVAALEQIEYFGTGGSVSLKPQVSNQITSITWKHKGNIVAEWFKDTDPLGYLGDLKGRLDLNLATGVLTVRNMVKTDTGTFSVEVNNIVLPDTFQAVWTENLNEYRVEVIPPLTCGSQSQDCKLRCGDEFKDAEPVEFFWKKGEAGEWVKGEKELLIENTEDTKRIKSFTCKAKNKISEKESEPEENPFTKTKPDNTTGIVVGIIIALIVVLAAGAGAFMWIKKIGPFRQSNPDPHPGNGTERNGTESNRMLDRSPEPQP